MSAAPTDEDAFSLPPGSTATRFFELEKQTIFRQAWQLVCHQSDVPNAGDYHSFDFMGESVIVLRGEDGRSAASTTPAATGPRALDEPKGHCAV